MTILQERTNWKDPESRFVTSGTCTSLSFEKEELWLNRDGVFERRSGLSQGRGTNTATKKSRDEKKWN